MRKTWVGIAAAALGVAAVWLPAGAPVAAAGGGTNDGTGPKAPDNGCHTTITNGTGTAAISVCITSHGNIGGLAFGGIEQIRNGGIYEGYLICDSAVDQMFTDSGFNPPTITQPNGPNTLPLTIRRTTTDGKWQLTQNFGVSPDAVTVTMALKNTSGVVQSGVRLARVADIDAAVAQTGSFVNHWTRTPDSVSAVANGVSGTQMLAASYNAAHAAQAQGPGPSTVCDVPANATPGDFDGHGQITYSFPNVGASVIKTVKVTYRRL